MADGETNGVDAVASATEAAIVNGRYYGSYRHKVDEKKRVPIPFRWRPDESIEFMLAIWPKHQAGTCLRVLLPDQWAKLLVYLDSLPNNDPDKAVLKRFIGTSSRPAKLDNAGRIAIPNELADAAEITKECVLAGLIDRFEIWSPERYNKVKILDEAVSRKAFDKLE